MLYPAKTCLSQQRKNRFVENHLRDRLKYIDVYEKNRKKTVSGLILSKIQKDVKGGSSLLDLVNGSIMKRYDDDRKLTSIDNDDDEKEDKTDKLKKRIKKLEESIKEKLETIRKTNKKQKQKRLVKPKLIKKI